MLVHQRVTEFQTPKNARDPRTRATRDGDAGGLRPLPRWGPRGHEIATSWGELITPISLW